jgi:murein DD-endopeptidase MepM/ murein hydrolase activator NlpD
VIEATLPPAEVRGAIEAPVFVRARGPAALTTVALDGTPLSLPGGPTIGIDTAALPDGAHVLQLSAADGSLRRNRATLELHFTSDNTPPTLSVTPFGRPDRLRAGQAAALSLAANEPAELRAEWQGVPLPLLRLSSPIGAQLALVAAPVTATSAPATLTISGRDRAGNTATQQTEIPVESAIVPRQNLLVPPALASLATGPVASDEAARLAALTGAVRPERLWGSEFRPPLSGPRTTGFGDRRDYADGHVTAHSGYDVAAPAGAAVLAAAAGVVSHVGALPQRGNVVILDHGWGVYTVYAHLLEARAAEGQSVAQGQVVGLVGNTGLSTGPHLHWEVRLRGQAVDPDTWIALSRAIP